MIPYGKQDINQADIESVINVLQSDFLTQGPQVPLFEKTVSNYCNARFGIATNSATSALHLACLFAINCGKTVLHDKGTLLNDGVRDWMQLLVLGGASPTKP